MTRRDGYNLNPSWFDDPALEDLLPRKESNRDVKEPKTPENEETSPERPRPNTRERKFTW